MSNLLDRAAGCLVGVAVGDALGGLAEVQALSDFATEATSDDTAQTLIIAESIAACGGIEPDDIAKRLVVWFRRDCHGIGAFTSKVLERLSEGENWQEAALEVLADNPASAGNGSLMRCAPVALFRQGDLEVLISDSRLCSRVTHPQDECEWSCAFANMVTGGLLAGRTTTGAISEALAMGVEHGGFPEVVLERAERSLSQGTSKGLLPGGYVLDTLECSLWALSHHSSFEDTVQAAVALGGDADTIGAVAGAFAGAAYGISALPGKWLTFITCEHRLQSLSRKIINTS